MSIIEALKTLQIRKGELLEYCYGKNYGGIDSAIPRNIADELQARGENLYYYATDCRTSCFRVVNLLDILSEEKKALLIVKAILYHDLNSRILDYENNSNIYTWIEKKIRGNA